MRSTLRIRWLKNHGIRIIRRDGNGQAERFEPFGGSVSVSEAAAALAGSDAAVYRTKVKIYRMMEKKTIKARTIAGEYRIPVSELWRLKRDRTPLEDGRKKRQAAA
jgi:hypothetical protein